VNLVQELTSYGFEPNPGRSATYVEYAKTYCTADGEYVRVFLHFDKPIMGMTGLRLANVTVTTQRAVSPDLNDIAAQVHDIARDEVLELVAGLPTQIPQQSVSTRHCIKCERSAAEFYVINEDAVCYACVEAHGPT